MGKLFMKDVKLVGITNLIVLGIAILAGCLGTLGLIDQGLVTNFFYGLAIVVSWFMVHTSIAAKEMKSKSDSLILSLPIEKFDIIKSRYLTMLIYVFGSLGIIYLTSNLMRTFFSNLSGQSLTLTGILIIASIMLTLISFHLPFQYYDERSAQFLPAIVQILVISSPNIVKKFAIDIDSFAKVLTWDFKRLTPIFLVGALVLYLISLLVSKVIYEAKEA